MIKTKTKQTNKLNKLFKTTKLNAFIALFTILTLLVLSSAYAIGPTKVYLTHSNNPVENEYFYVNFAAYSDYGLEKIRIGYHGEWIEYECNLETECHTSWQLRETIPGEYKYKVQAISPNNNRYSDLVIVNVIPTEATLQEMSVCPGITIEQKSCVEYLKDADDCYYKSLKEAGTKESKRDCDYLDDEYRNYHDVWNTCDGSGNMIYAECNVYDSLIDEEDCVDEKPEDYNNPCISYSKIDGCYIKEFKDEDYILNTKNCDSYDTPCRDYLNVHDYCDGKGNVIIKDCDDYDNLGTNNICSSEQQVKCIYNQNTWEDPFQVTVNTYCGDAGLCDGATEYEVFNQIGTCNGANLVCDESQGRCVDEFNENIEETILKVEEAREMLKNLVDKDVKEIDDSLLLEFLKFQTLNQDSDESNDIHEDELIDSIVILGENYETKKQALIDMGYKIEMELTIIDAVVIKIPYSISEVFNILELDVESIQADNVMQSLNNNATTFSGADTLHTLLDGFGNNLDGTGVRIAVIDSGIDYTHLDFGGTGSKTFHTHTNTLDNSASTYDDDGDVIYTSGEVRIKYNSTFGKYAPVGLYYINVTNSWGLAEDIMYVTVDYTGSQPSNTDIDFYASLDNGQSWEKIVSGGAAPNRGPTGTGVLIQGVLEAFSYRTNTPSVTDVTVNFYTAPPPNPDVIYDMHDYYWNNNNVYDFTGHGTHVAGTIAGRGIENPQYKGIAHNATLAIYQSLSQTGFGSTSKIVGSLQRALDPNEDGNYSDRADIASISIGGFGTPYDAISQAVDVATAEGMLVVVAAGNDGPGAQTILCPGCAKTAVAVGATMMDDDMASFSSRGPYIHQNTYLVKPNIATLGRYVNSTNPNGGYLRRQGTSMATPVVSGVAALLKQKYPSYNYTELRSLLINTVRTKEISFVNYGPGILDSVAAHDSKLLISPTQLEYGLINDVENATHDETITLTLREILGTTTTFDLSYEIDNSTGISFTYPASVSFTPNQEQQIDITLHVDTLNTPKQVFIGRFNLTDQGTGKVYTVPFIFKKENIFGNYDPIAIISNGWFKTMPVSSSTKLFGYESYDPENLPLTYIWTRERGNSLFPTAGGSSQNLTVLTNNLGVLFGFGVYSLQVHDGSTYSDKTFTTLFSSNSAVPTIFSDEFHKFVMDENYLDRKRIDPSVKVDQSSKDDITNSHFNASTVRQEHPINEDAEEIKICVIGLNWATLGNMSFSICKKDTGMMCVDGTQSEVFTATLRGPINSFGERFCTDYINYPVTAGTYLISFKPDPYNTDIYLPIKDYTVVNSQLVLGTRYESVWTTTDSDLQSIDLAGTVTHWPVNLEVYKGLGKIKDFDVMEGETISYNLSKQGFTINYDPVSVPNAGVDASGNWITSAGDAGIYEVNVSVSNVTHTESRISTIIISAMPGVNNLPVINPPYSVSGDEGTLISYTIDATDADGDTLFYAINDTGRFNLVGNTFTWTPGYSDAGVYSVRASVFDGKNTTSQDITVTVNDVPGPELSIQNVVINPVPARTVIDTVFNFDMVNSGTIDANNVKIRVIYGDGVDETLTNSINIPASSSLRVQLFHKYNSAYASLTPRIIIDPLDTIPEEDETNNEYDSTSITVI